MFAMSGQLWLFESVYILQEAFSEISARSREKSRRALRAKINLTLPSLNYSHPNGIFVEHQTLVRN